MFDWTIILASIWESMLDSMRPLLIILIILALMAPSIAIMFFNSTKRHQALHRELKRWNCTPIHIKALPLNGETFPDFRSEAAYKISQYEVTYLDPSMQQQSCIATVETIGIVKCKISFTELPQSKPPMSDSPPLNTDQYQHLPHLPKAERPGMSQRLIHTVKHNRYWG